MDDEIERIRAEKLEQLRERATQREETGANQAPAGSTSPDSPISIRDEAHFKRVLADHDPVLVDFYADWCGPCQMLAPVLERLAAETDGTIAKVDTEALPGLAQQFGVRGLPTLVRFENGQPATRAVGMQDEATLRDLLA